MANPVKHILNPQQIAHAKRWYEQGYKITHIAELLKVSRNTVSRAIKGTKSKPNAHPWKDDIEELLAEGHTVHDIEQVFGPEAIKAVFGEVV